MMAEIGAVLLRLGHYTVEGLMKDKSKNSPAPL